MPELQPIDPKTSALLLMDFQGFILDNFLPGETASEVVGQAAKLLRAARAAGMLVIHVGVMFRPGYPEISPRNKLFSGLKDSGLATPGSEGAKIIPALAPVGNEPVVAKHRVGSFTGTDMERILRANGTETLIIGGVATSGVVLSTVRLAFDLDYALIVAREACADADSEVHAVLLDKVFARQTTVASVEEIEAALS